MLNRRSLIRGLFVAPAIIRTPGLLMPIKPFREEYPSGYGRWLDYYTAVKPEADLEAWAAEMMRTISMHTGIPEKYLKGTARIV
jgi:hypothetical protein